MYLLDGLSWGVLLSPANGMIKDDDLLDTGYLLAKHVLDLLIVSFSHSRIVGEQLFLGRKIVDGETRVIRGEFMFLAAYVVNLSGVIFLLEVVARAIDLRPRLALIRACVNVNKICGSHLEFWIAE